MYYKLKTLLGRFFISLPLNFLFLCASVFIFSFAQGATDPLQENINAWQQKGFTLQDRFQQTTKDSQVVVLLFASGQKQRLEMYSVLNGKSVLGYYHPTLSDTLQIVRIPQNTHFSKLGKAGSLYFAYRSTSAVLKSSALHVLRYENYKFEQLATFPEGQFIVDEGHQLIVVRDLPLGKFLSVGCNDFGTMSQNAYRTILYEARPGRFKNVNEEHGNYFSSEISRKEKKLNELKADLQKNAGEYLGLALSSYFDYAARGEGQKGWARQNEFFQIPAYSPPSVRSCFSTIREDLRKRLHIPDDWN